MSDTVMDGILRVLEGMLPLVQEIHETVTEEPGNPNPAAKALNRISAALEANTREIAALNERLERGGLT